MSTHHSDRLPDPPRATVHAYTLYWEIFLTPEVATICQRSGRHVKHAELSGVSSHPFSGVRLLGSSQSYVSSSPGSMSRNAKNQTLGVPSIETGIDLTLRLGSFELSGEVRM